MEIKHKHSHLIVIILNFRILMIIYFLRKEKVKIFFEIFIKMTKYLEMLKHHCVRRTNLKIKSFKKKHI